MEEVEETLESSMALTISIPLGWPELLMLVKVQ